MNVYSMNYYKRLGISEKEVMPKTASFYFILIAMLIVLIGSLLYSVFVAPIFIPLPIIICLVERCLCFAEFRHLFLIVDIFTIFVVYVAR